VSKSVQACIALVAVVLSGTLAAAQNETAQAGQIFRDCSDCPEMVVVPAGRFSMGLSPQEAERDLKLLSRSEVESFKYVFKEEQPLHSVGIAQPFGMGRYLVTRGEFAAFVRETGYEPLRGCAIFANRYRPNPVAGWRAPGFTQTDKDPVVCVSWKDAQAYVAWLNGKVRKPSSAGQDGPYRLPSEAEWEYAARGGTRTVWWWGDAISSNDAACEGCGNQWDDKQPAPVGTFFPNPFGLFDILGNVWEWTEDCWNLNYEGAPVDGSPWTSGKWCHVRTIRGGSFGSRPWVIRPTRRTSWGLDQPANLIGFRVAKALQ
jgi:formylglycine-generating enzyme required for sulfatase activity